MPRRSPRCCLISGEVVKRSLKTKQLSELLLQGDVAIADERCDRAGQDGGFRTAPLPGCVTASVASRSSERCSNGRLQGDETSTSRRPTATSVTCMSSSPVVAGVEIRRPRRPSTTSSDQCEQLDRVVEDRLCQEPCSGQRLDRHRHVEERASRSLCRRQGKGRKG